MRKRREWSRARIFRSSGAKNPGQENQGNAVGQKRSDQGDVSAGEVVQQDFRGGDAHERIGQPYQLAPSEAHPGPCQDQRKNRQNQGAGGEAEARLAATRIQAAAAASAGQVRFARDKAK